MGKKISFYFVHDNGYLMSRDSQKYYCPDLDSALETIRNMFLNGSDSISVEFLGEHELKF